jgi:hypothetical protein
MLRRMKSDLAPALLLLLASLVGGCSPVPKCVPGTSQGCTCVDGKAGAQVCSAKGAFDACVCDGSLDLAGIVDLSTEGQDLIGRDLRQPPLDLREPADLRQAQVDMKPALPACTFVSPCWNTCVNNGTSVSTCKSTCGATTGPDCWMLCIAQGVSVSTCKSYCGGDPGCQAATCWSLCIAQGVSISTCKSYCGIDKTTCSSCAGSPSAWRNCYALCDAQGVSTSTCKSYCGD